MATMSASWSRDRSSRFLLLASLALNLFFLGLVGAGALRHFWHPGPPAALEPSRTAAERIDRLAATLPSDDAEKLRAEFRRRETTLEATHAAYRKAQDTIRAAIRAEPFDIEAVRSAMAETRGARQALDLALHDVIANAAAQMSVAGRNKLADWTPPVHNAAGASR